jgi:CheY-like chemotaxis protein
MAISRTHEFSMKILLIEDDENKRHNILNALQRECPSATIVTTHSVRRAIDTLAGQPFDLVVADMSLPTFDIELREPGGTPRPFGGIEVFEFLERIDCGVPVLVVTSYPILTDGKRSLSVKDLQQQLHREFPSNFAGIIYFDSALTDWERDMQQFLKQKFG